LAFTPFHSDSGGYTANNAHVWVQNIPYLKGVREPVEYQSPNTNWTAKIPASQVQAALSKIGGNVGQIKEIRVSETDAGGRAITLTFVGSSGSFSAKSSNFRTAIGSTVLKSTMLITGGVPMAAGFEDTAAPPAVEIDAEPKRPLDVSYGNESLVQASDVPMSGSEEMRLMHMTSDGAFTAEELMDMLLNPDKRRGYFQKGIQRNSETKKKEFPEVALPKSLPGVSMPPIRSTEPIREENGFFVFRGKGSGHGLGLSQWGAQALAQKGWPVERILEHYYPGTAVKHFK
jgi:stage II sporulation protein D